MWYFLDDLLRAFTFRLYPNATQRAALGFILADSAETYNAALQERRDAWKMQRESITLYDQFKQITELRKDRQFATIAADIQREPLRRVDKAFKAFFRRCKAGERPGYPRFKSKYRYNSFTFGDRLTVRERSLKIPKLGDVRMRGGLLIEGMPKTVTVKRDGKRWTARVVCDIGPAPEKQPVSRPVGIDLGLRHFVTLSDGTQIENPRWTSKHEQRIALANRRLAKKQKRSKNRLRTKEALRRAHQRAANARSNYIHHVSKWLVADYDLIAHEDLNIKGMAQSHFGKSIMDAAWGQLIWQITYKAEEAGKWVVPINPRGTSQKCSGCGATVVKDLKQRRHECACGLSLDRDHNAALNILALGRSDVAVRAEGLVN